MNKELVTRIGIQAVVIKPDVVHIMANGRIVKTGGPELALEVENNGYSDILAEVA